MSMTDAELNAMLEQHNHEWDDGFEDIPALIAEVRRLRAVLLSMKSDKHEECDDCWYSCPKSGHCCNEDYANSDMCTCGVDARNEIIDNALKGDE